MTTVWFNEMSRINEMTITDEFYMVSPRTRGRVVARRLKKLQEGGVILVAKNKEKVIGYITRKEIVNTVADGENPLDLSAKDLMDTDFMEVVEDEMLGNVLPMLSEKYPNAIVVIDYEGKCVGFFSKNDYKDALALLGIYDRSHEPETPDEWRTQGIAMSSMGQPKKALECYEKSLALYGDQERGWFELARSFEGSGRFKDSLMCYERVNAINPNNEDAWLNRGNVYALMRNVKRSLQCYSKALALKPDDVKILTNMGLAYSDLGKLNEAIKCFDRADALQGETAAIWYSKGNAYDKAEQEKKAIKCYDKALKLNPNHEDAWFNKGGSLHVLGKEKKAAQCFKEVLRINPQNQSAREAITVCENDKGVGFF